MTALGWAPDRHAGRPGARRCRRRGSRCSRSSRSDREPVSLAALAAVTGLHANTLREHLDALIDAGLVGRERAPAAGRGRPAWLYSAVPDGELPGGAAEYAGLASALAEVIEQSSSSPRRDAIDAGRRWGRQLATDRGSGGGGEADARRDVVQLLDGLGFAPQPDARHAVVRLTRCPLLEAARRHPEIVCGVHLGIVRGALEVYGGETDRADLLAFAEPGACRLELTSPGRPRRRAAAVTASRTARPVGDGHPVAARRVPAARRPRAARRARRRPDAAGPSGPASPPTGCRTCTECCSCSASSAPWSRSSGPWRCGTRPGSSPPRRSASGGLLLIFPAPLAAGRVALCLGALALVGVYVPLWRRQRDDAVLVQALGAVLAVGAALLWLAGVDVAVLLPWLVGFVVLTIGGERLELARLAMGPRAGSAFLALSAALVAGVVAALLWPGAGYPLLGLALLALVGWLAGHDVARRTVRSTGLARFVAGCLLAGYGWLAVAGACWLLGGAAPDGPRYDAVVHAVFLGFTLSMIMAHAPVILPAVLRRPLPYHPAMIAPGRPAARLARAAALRRRRPRSPPRLAGRRRPQHHRGAAVRRRGGLVVRARRTPGRCVVMRGRFWPLRDIPAVVLAGCARRRGAGAPVRGGVGLAADPPAAARRGDPFDRRVERPLRRDPAAGPDRPDRAPPAVLAADHAQRRRAAGGHRRPERGAGG